MPPASDPQADAGRRHVELLGSYRAVFEGQDGLRVLTDILRHAGMLETSHIPGDSHETAFNEGRRSMGLHVLERLRWTELQLLRLARERTAEAVADPPPPPTEE